MFFFFQAEDGIRDFHVTGVQTCALPISREQGPNPYSTPDLTFQFHYFAMRKMHLAMRAAALVVFPGGFGTLRSEEHTSELQSREKLVCRLLLEKKKEELIQHGSGENENN